MTMFYEPGKYLGRMVSIQLGKAGTGNPQVAFTFEVLSKSDGSPVKAQYERTVFRTITENTIDYLVEDLNNLGYPFTTFDQLDEAHPQHWNCPGKEVTVACKEHVYNSEAKEQWSFSGGGKLEVKPLDNSAVANLNALYGSKLKNGRASKPSTASLASSGAAKPGLSSAPKTLEEAI